MLEYPDLPLGPIDREHCYVLGWLLDDVSDRMLEIAGCEVSRPCDPGFREAFVRAMFYMWAWGDYRHSWTTVFPKDTLEGNGPLDPAMSEGVDDEGVWFLAIPCSDKAAYNQRPSKASLP